MKNRIALTTIALSIALTSYAAAEESFTEACASAADKASGRSVAGADGGWLFLKSEIAHLGTGAFWEKDWATISEAGTDPVPMFLALKAKLQAMGVDFIFVPVPAKAAIYPEKMIAGAKAGDAVALAPFLKRLKDGGITVIDLEPELLAARSGEPSPSYCKTDAHPAPSTFQRIAASVAAELQDEPWIAAAAAACALQFELAEPSTIEIKGDLIPDDKIASWPAEKLQITKVSAGGEQVRPEDEASPVIVLGDSHAMYFSQGPRQRRRSGRPPASAARISRLPRRADGIEQPGAAPNLQRPGVLEGQKGAGLDLVGARVHPGAQVVGTTETAQVTFKGDLA